MQIKTQQDIIHGRMAIIKMSDDNKCWQECGEVGTSYTAGRNINGITVLENNLAVLQKNSIIAIWLNNSISNYVLKRN